MTYRSEKLRRIVAEMDCALCESAGPSQAAHCNQGKGMGLKASDATIFPACPACHRAVDEGGMPREERRKLEAELNLKTLRTLLEEGKLVLR